MLAAPPALLAAIRGRDVARITELLADDPALAQARATGGETLVLHACYLGAAELVPALLAGRPLDACEAAALGEVEALAHALGEDDDARVRRSSDGWTPLHLAAFFGQDGAATLLIDHGAPLDAHSTNATRNTPLHAALAGALNATVVRRLVFAGADVTARAAHGVTPLHLAASRGDGALCDLLVLRGADPHAPMDDGTTPPQMAAARGFGALGERLAALRR
jgi:ankyrin repeat protein